MRFILGFVVGMTFGFGIASLLTRPGDDAFRQVRER
jgi:hypothetical protein